MRKVCPRDGIGRHAWLKTTSLWGPGSSPGVGIISEFFRDSIYIRFSTINRRSKVSVSEQIPLVTAIFGPLTSFAVAFGSLLFFICPITTLTSHSLIHTCGHSFFDFQPLSFNPCFIISASTDLISESSVTTLLSHAAFFYLLCCVFFLIPVFILS